MNYRREIDGLRALAVLPVILFHAGFETFSGGFVGVDVFFVISGYLITTIILAELEQERFSIVNFYERRARRILPALFFVMFTCIPFAWFWLLPGDMKDFSQSVAAVSLFASNILFSRESGYFATAAELKPLLHTWSLAVEEQYYVIFPLVLMALWRLGRAGVLIFLAVLFVVSFFMAEWGYSASSRTAFFHLPARGWELLLGAFAAFYLSSPDRHEFSRGLREIGGCLGVVLILVAVFSYGKTTPFPGMYALVPTAGAALIVIFATQSTVVGRFLGGRAFVGVGLVSYSAYLWHQPLFAFARHRSLKEPSHAAFIALSILALLLAYLTWRYVENPFRHKAKISRRRIFILSLTCSGASVLFGVLGHLSGGAFMLESREHRMDSLQSRIVINRGLDGNCEGLRGDSNACSTSEVPEVLVWGDSYAMHLVQGLLASKEDLKLIQKTASVCGPLLGIAPEPHKRKWSERCLDFNSSVYEYLQATPSIKYVVLGSLFELYVNEGSLVLDGAGRVTQGSDVAFAAMMKTIEGIKGLGKVPVVFSPPPKSGEDIGRCLVKAAQFNEDDSRCDISLSASRARNEAVYRFLQRIEKEASVVWLSDGVCSLDTCKASIDGVFIYRDSGHLSVEGSVYLGKKLDFYGRLHDAVGHAVQ